MPNGSAVAEIEKTRRGILAHQIGGAAYPPAAGRGLPVDDPATGHRIAEQAAGDAADVEAAVTAAEAAAAEWARMEVSARSRLLHRFADAIDEHAAELAELDVADTGKPLAVAAGSVGRAADTVRWYAGWAQTLRGAMIPVTETELTYTSYEPYGVVAAIIPWNYPASNFATKVAPILACGNAVVVKPAEQAPLVPLRMAMLAAAAGLPAGLVNTVTGDGPTTGAALAAHPRIRKVAFTGSSETGRALVRNGSDLVRSFTLELGGKTASLILPDADLDTAADAAVHTSFANSGQTCTAGSRVLVHEDAHDALVERILRRTEALGVGDPRDPGTHVGALISAEHLQRVLGYIETARTDAVVRAGGHRLHPAGFEDGWWVAPTVVDRVAPESPLFREEIFGPVLTITGYRDLDEGIALANDTEYGLAATVWGNRPDQVRYAVRALDAGIVWANTIHRLHPAVPYGGRRQSGVGVELGAEAQYEYMLPKTVWLGDTGWRSPWA